MTSEQALARLQHLCSRSEKCIADVQKKLHKWEVPEKEAKAIVVKLLADKFIDETRYAHAFVRDKYRLSHWGILKIRQALQAKKISTPIIAEALKEIDANDYKKELLALLKRKNATLKTTTSSEELKVKLLRFAVSKGYEYNVVYDLLTNFSK